MRSVSLGICFNGVTAPETYNVSNFRALFLLMVHLSYASSSLTVLLRSCCLRALDLIDLEEDKYFSVLALGLQENEEPMIKTVLMVL